MSENTITVESVTRKPLIQLTDVSAEESAEAGCCGGGSCGV
ncbi:hypothetical protein EV379_1748 [Microterricola gilva]|uniref:Thiazolylpeptide-type bacteriocin n=1 Tax=Microterricola gilva TaxID=393267 RepID=A0A4Q8ALK1_9MICO|nr:hypothetical protein [Microterricola gilva]RZU65414.1 hypothetical protein EV379_1748 [Microterricola gilva]